VVMCKHSKRYLAVGVNCDAYVRTWWVCHEGAPVRFLDVYSALRLWMVLWVHCRVVCTKRFTAFLRVLRRLPQTDSYDS